MTATIMKRAVKLSHSLMGRKKTLGQWDTWDTRAKQCYYNN